MIEKIHNDVMFWLQQIGDFVKTSMQETLMIDTKTSLSDLVTNVDKAVEAKFIDFIHAYYPTHSVLGEESSSHLSCPKQGHIWIIDPIDGTLNFVKAQKNFAIMIALYVNGVGQLGYIYDVMSDALYYAIKGQGAFCNNQRLMKPDDLLPEHSLINLSACFIHEDCQPYAKLLKQVQGIRVIGSASHSMLSIFANQHHAYISKHLKAWDYMTGLIFADELGLLYSTRMGEKLPLFEPTDFVMATPTLHHQIITEYRAYVER